MHFLLQNKSRFGITSFEIRLWKEPKERLTFPVEHPRASYFWVLTQAIDLCFQDEKEKILLNATRVIASNLPKWVNLLIQSYGGREEMRIRDF